jgi:hypothetical protein
MKNVNEALHLASGYAYRPLVRCRGRVYSGVGFNPWHPADRLYVAIRPFVLA